MRSQSDRITELLVRFRAGDADAKEQLFKLVFPELRRIAARKIRREPRGLTLQTGDLVNEAYLRLTSAQELEVKDRIHFYALAATFMRRILIDHARQRVARPRSNESIVELRAPGGFVVDDHAYILDIHDALSRLEKLDPRQGQIVEMRFFGGMQEEEIAEYLGISSRTVKRDWAMARAWLAGELPS